MSHLETPSPDLSSTAARAAFAAFAFAWAIANVIHLWIQNDASVDQPAAVLNLAAAAWVLLDPRSVPRLVVLAVTQLADTVWVMPFAPDHQMLAAGVNVVIVLAWLSAWVRSRRQADRRAIDAADHYAAFAPAARILLLVGYSAAAIAKYNDRFFDPAVSCAVHLAGLATFTLSEQTPVLEWFHILASVTAETLIPLLLFIPATRRFGARFGMAFHFLVSLSPAITVDDFTTALFALFLLFLAPGEVGAMFTDMGDRFRRSIVGQSLLIKGRVPLVGAFVVTAGLSGYLLPVVNVLYLWVVTTWFGVSLLRAAKRTWTMDVAVVPLAVRIPVTHIVVIGVLFVWALNPYLGMRTTSSFTMFSNLVTEGPGTNHFFLPSFHLVDHQNQLVAPLRSSNERLQELADDGQLLTVFEMQRFLRDDPDASVVVRWDDEVITVRDPEQLGEPPHPVLTKIWFFRWIAGTGDPQCTN